MSNVADVMSNVADVVSESSVDNLYLWNAVSKTDPAHTKPATLNKKLTITVINPQYQIKQATEQFGPYGSTWGLKNINRDFSLLDRLNLVMFDAVFYYPGGEFEISNSHKIFMDRQNTIVDTDFCKKMETDILTKALSKIGFNADVFMGRYDDVKYVNELREEFNKPKTISQRDQNRLLEYMQSVNFNPEQFCESWQIGHLSDLHQENIQNAFNWVQGCVEQQQIHEQNDHQPHQIHEPQQQINDLAPEQPLNDAQARADEMVARHIASSKKDYERAEIRRQHNNELEQARQEQLNQKVGYRVITPAQNKNLRSFMNRANMDETVFCRIAKINQLGVLQEERFGGAITWLRDMAVESEQRRIRSS